MSTSKKKSLRFVCISDTHNRHASLNVPFGDVLIHAGDFTVNGTESEIDDFVSWFETQPHEYKILIAGNHELTLDSPFYQKNWELFHEEKYDELKIKKTLRNNSNFVYLEKESVQIEGLNFYGNPTIPRMNKTRKPWAFTCPRGKLMKEVWSHVPSNVDILITHTPPFGILDETTIRAKHNHAGDEELLLQTKKVKPRYHIFGHVHECQGLEETKYTTFVNACSLSRDYTIQLPLAFDVDL